MRTKIRDAVLFTVVFFSFPLWLLVRIRLFRFGTMAEILSLVPGTLGLWLRRSFYYMELTDAPRDVSVSFGSVFSDKKVFLGERVSLGGWSSVNQCRIGHGTLIGSHVDIFSGRYQHGNFETITRQKEENDYLDSETLISIGDNVWIGDGVIVCADIGENSIIGAGAVVVKPIPSNSIAVGNPARVIKQNQTA